VQNAPKLSAAGYRFNNVQYSRDIYRELFKKTRYYTQRRLSSALSTSEPNSRVVSQCLLIYAHLGIVPAANRHSAQHRQHRSVHQLPISDRRWLTGPAGVRLAPRADRSEKTVAPAPTSRGRTQCYTVVVALSRHPRPASASPPTCVERLRVAPPRLPRC